MSDNPFLKRIAQKGTTGHGRKSERRVAKSLGARLTPGSGNMRGFKGDSKLQRGRHRFLVESKSTVHATMTLELEWLVKITSEALNTSKHPALTVSFVTPEGKARVSGDWVMMPKWLFDELTE